MSLSTPEPIGQKQRNDVLERENEYRHARVERNYVWLYRIRMAWFISMLAAFAGALVIRRLTGKALLTFGGSLTLFIVPWAAVVSWLTGAGDAVRRVAGKVIVNPFRY